MRKYWAACFQSISIYFPLLSSFFCVYAQVNLWSNFSGARLHGEKSAIAAPALSCEKEGRLRRHSAGKAQSFAGEKKNQGTRNQVPVDEVRSPACASG